MSAVRSRTLPVARLGIIGGGQLARMLVPEAARLGCETVVLDPTPASPGGELATRQIEGTFDDAGRLRELVSGCTVTTYEIETIDTDALRVLEAEGHRIIPAPAVLAVIQDKLLQKERLAAAGIPVPEFRALDEPDPMAMAAFGLPLVQKARRGGYDGRGVAVFTDVVIEEQVLPGPSMVERYIDYRCELAVLVARGGDGETRSWPVVEMVFDDRANVLDLLLAPARIEPELAELARSLAIGAVEALEGVGVFGVELFLTRSGELLVNEIAPRTHNSGHWTIEGCHTSQFEQHVRAVMGMALGTTERRAPTVSANVLGDVEERQPATLVGEESVLSTPRSHLHWYGKHDVYELRKMGHVTLVGGEDGDAESDTDDLLGEVRALRDGLTFRQ